jgi:putative acetyltransferase
MIREYRHHDRDEAVDVWERASRLAHPFLDEAFFVHEREMVATVHLAQAETWVFVRDAGLAGFISLIGNEVGGLFIDPRVHGQGMGRALVDHAAALRPVLEVEVFAANHIGRRFYDRYGFRQVAQLVHEPTGQAVLRLRYRRC